MKTLHSDSKENTNFQTEAATIAKKGINTRHEIKTGRRVLMIQITEEEWYLHPQTILDRQNSAGRISLFYFITPKIKSRQLSTQQHC